jgi:formate hydrogenlyase transcriptional activator
VTLDDLERAHIRRMLEASNWKIEGDGGAARVLGLNPSTLRGRMRKLNIRRTL